MDRVVSGVKNLLRNIIGGEERENVRQAEGSGVQFSRTNISSRKRTTSNVFELELTDDEEDAVDIGFTPAFHNPQEQSYHGSKRLRYTDTFEMASPSSSKRCRNIPIQVEAETQTGTNLRPSDKENQKRNTSVEASPIPSTSTRPTRKSSSGIDPTSSHFYFKPSEPTPGPSRTKSIEVITLDDEPQPKLRKEMAPPPSSNELSLLKRTRTNPMKSRARGDSNKLTRALLSIGNRVTSATRSAAYRFKEKNRYMQLLMAHNLMNNDGKDGSSSKALTKSSVDRSDLQVLYNRFGASPSDGAVSINVNRARAYLPLPPTTSPQVDLDLSRALVPLPKLYSSFYDLDVIPPTTIASSKLKAITYDKIPVPELIDLEKEPEYTTSGNQQPLSPITPVKRDGKVYLSPEKVAFSNLDEALDAAGLRGVEPAFEEKVSDADVIPVEDDDAPEEDPDLSIIAEEIVNKSRLKSVNSLALENSLCPYVDKKWLEQSKLSWRERQKMRDSRILEESKVIDILKKESTLEQDLNDRVRKRLTLTEIIVLEEPPPTLPEITDDMRRIINHAKMRGNDNEVLAQVRLLKDTIDITRGDIKTLGGLQWLNDNVINTYLGLITLRGKQDNFLSVYTFQTFFYPKLLKEGYSNSLKRWTRKDDIFAHDLIILPIHLGVHWCLACIDLRKKEINYYDSMLGSNQKCLHSLLEYLAREMKERKQVDLIKTEWKLENVKEIPQQENGSDCGMFACKFAEYLSRGAKITFTQKDMPYFRDRMIYELLRQDLLHP